MQNFVLSRKFRIYFLSFCRWFKVLLIRRLGYLGLLIAVGIFVLISRSTNILIVVVVFWVLRSLWGRAKDILLLLFGRNTVLLALSDFSFYTFCLQPIFSCLGVNSFVFLDSFPNFSDVYICIVILRKIVFVSNLEVLLETFNVLLPVVFIFANRLAVGPKNSNIFTLERPINSNFP